MTTISTLRPGLLVSLSTSIRGNVTYHKVDLENRHLDSFGQERAKWETTRVTADPAEHEAAVKVRSKARSLITGACSQSAFGLLCPESNADKLDEAIRAARALADDFNASASLTNVSVNVLCGRIAQDDVQAVQAISREVRELMEDMQNGLRNLDVEAVRTAASKARSVGEMLSDDAKGRLEVAISAARSSARKIVKAGDEVAIAIDKATIAKIDMARTSFLDIDIEDAFIATPEMDSRALDFDTEGTILSFEDPDDPSTMINVEV